MSTRSFWRDLSTDEAGATAIEYGLICGLIVIAIFTAMQGFANANRNTWNTVTNSVDNAIAQGTGG